MDAANGVRARLAQLSQRFPHDLAYTVSLDTTAAVTAGMKEIVYTLFEALGLVVLVVYLFLQGWRATLIPLLAVPVSLIGTFAVFPLLGFSINTLSLFGLVLAIGLVVDDAIVVVEAVERHIEEGMTPRDAALKAMDEVSGPVVAIALILAAVFIPTMFIPGITGRLVSAIRGDHRDLGDSFGVQRAVAESRAGGAAAEAERQERKPGPLGRFFNWFNRVFGACDGRVRRDFGGADSQGGGERWCCWRSSRSCAVGDRTQAAEFVSAGRRLRLRVRESAACRTRLRCSGQAKPRARWKT